MKVLKSILVDFSHLFFPQLCAGCGTDLNSTKAVLCFQCISRLPLTNFLFYEGNQVERIFYGRIPVNTAASFCYFTKDSLMQRILHQIKYRGNQELGYFMGRMMAKALLQGGRAKNVEALVPLPLFTARERRRGYNQATVLCEGMASVMQIPVLNNVVGRFTATETQTHKNRIERWQNMKGRFEIKDVKSIAGKHLLLVDDVITTGATLEACALELLKADQSQVSIMTLAYTS